MKFLSTRSTDVCADLKTALLKGLAPDGGLYLPQTIPQVSRSTSKKWSGLSFGQLAGELAALWLGDEIDPDLLRMMAREAYTFPIPIVMEGGGQGRMELFHGPSLSFKDVAAGLMLRILDHLLEKNDERALILTATSGDTGSAVAAACRGRERVQAVILYPAGLTSPVQEAQITASIGNVLPVRVPGTFDDCQRLVKARMARPAPKEMHLTSANSINIGRLLPQTAYHWFAALHHPGAWLVVPSGNFGNLTAGVLAKKMGAPIGQFVAATNNNDSVPRYLSTGRYTPAQTRRTLSNAMDVGDPSNVERLRFLFGDSATAMAREITGCVVTDDETRTAIREVFEATGVFLDPHTAVAWSALARVAKARGEVPGIALATAHPAKFPEIVMEATGKVPPIPPALQAAISSPKKVETLPTAELAALEDLLGRL